MSPYCQSNPAVMQQQHKSTTATTAMIRVVLFFLGSSGAGVIGVSMGSSKNDRMICYDAPIISGSFPVGASVKPVDEEGCEYDYQCAHQDRQDDREEG